MAQQDHDGSSVIHEDGPVAQVIPIFGRARRPSAHALRESPAFSRVPRSPPIIQRGTKDDSEASWESLRLRLEEQPIDDDIARAELELRKGNLEAVRTKAVLRNARAMRSFLRGAREAAFSEWQELIEDDPTLSGALLTRALFHARAGDLQAALADYDRAAELWPSAPEVYLRRGLCFYELEDMDRALPNFLRVVQLRPNDASAYLWLARTLRQRKETGGAIRAVGRAIKLAPWRAELHAFRAGCFFDQGSRADAKKDLDRTLELDPNDASALRLRACLHEGPDQETRELEDLSRAIVLEPKHVGALLSRAAIYERRGDIDPVIADLSRLAELCPKDVATLERRALAYQSQGSFAKAVADLSTAIALEDKPELLFLRAFALLRSGDETRARADLLRALALEPSLRDDLDARERKSHILSDKQALLDALDLLLLLDPKDDRRLGERGRLHLAARRYALARADFDRAIAEKPEDDELYHHRATALCSLGEFEGAARDEGRAMALAPYLARYPVWRAIYRAFGEGPSSEANADVARARELSPQSLAVLFLSSFYFQLTGRPKEAMALLDRRIAIAPDLGILYFQRAQARLRLEPSAAGRSLALSDLDAAIARGYATAEVTSLRAELEATPSGRG